MYPLPAAPGNKERVMIPVSTIIADEDKGSIIHKPDADQFIVRVVEKDCIRYFVAAIPELMAGLSMPSIGS